MMKSQPAKIVIAALEVIVMPNGEIICAGKSLGLFKNLKQYLTFVANGAE